MARELEDRDLKPSGFSGKDRALLQEAYNAERLVEVERMKIERGAKRERERLEAIAERRRAITERLLSEEFGALREDMLVRSWLKLLRSSTSPPSAAIPLGPVLVRSAAKALLGCTSLVSLTLSNQGIDDLGGSYIGRVLSVNQTVRYVHLGSNALGSRTARELGEALRQNTALVNLNLDCNPLGKIDGAREDLSGFGVFCSGLEENQSLRTLSLLRTGLMDDSGQRLASALGRNTTVLHCDVGGNVFSRSTEMKFYELLTAHNTRQVTAVHCPCFRFMPRVLCLPCCNGSHRFDEEKEEAAIASEREKATARAIFAMEEKERKKQADAQWAEDEKASRISKRLEIMVPTHLYPGILRAIHTSSYC